MGQRLNCRLRDLKLSSEDLNLVNEISNSIGMKNSDLVRLILHQQLKQIKASGISNFQLAIIGDRK